MIDAATVREQFQRFTRQGDDNSLRLRRLISHETRWHCGPFGTTLDASQVRRLHDAVPEARNSKEQRTWESRQQPIDALDEEAAAPRGRAGAGTIERRIARQARGARPAR